MPTFFGVRQEIITEHPELLRVSNTRSFTEIPCAVVQAGVDQFSFYVELSGESSEVARAHSSIGSGLKGMRSYKHLATPTPGEYTQWVRIAPEGYTWGYAEKPARLYIEHHPPRLIAAERVTEGVREALEVLRSHTGIETLFPVKMKRVDVAVDLAFKDPMVGRAVFETAAAMRGSRARRVERPFPETLYVRSSEASSAQRLGRIYDKGRERRVKAGWTLGDWIYLRFEAEKHWSVGDYVRSEAITSEWARETFLDRFGDIPSVGYLPGTRGPQMRIHELIQAGEMRPTKALRLLGYLTLEQSGMAEEVLGHRSVVEHRLECRRLGLSDTAIPSTFSEGDAELELEVSDLLAMMSGAL